MERLAAMAINICTVFIWVPIIDSKGGSTIKKKRKTSIKNESCAYRALLQVLLPSFGKSTNTKKKKVVPKSGGWSCEPRLRSVMWAICGVLSNAALILNARTVYSSMERTAFR